MSNRISLLHSTTAGARPTGGKPGEPWINLADGVLGYFDAAGVAVAYPPGRIQPHDPTRAYATGDYVSFNGHLYCALQAIAPGDPAPDPRPGNGAWMRMTTSANGSDWVWGTGVFYNPAGRVLELNGSEITWSNTTGNVRYELNAGPNSAVWLEAGVGLPYDQQKMKGRIFLCQDFTTHTRMTLAFVDGSLTQHDLLYANSDDLIVRMPTSIETPKVAIKAPNGNADGVQIFNGATASPALNIKGDGRLQWVTPAPAGFLLAQWWDGGAERLRISEDQMRFVTTGNIGYQILTAAGSAGHWFSGGPVNNQSQNPVYTLLNNGSAGSFVTPFRAELKDAGDNIWTLGSDAVDAAQGAAFRARLHLTHSAGGAAADVVTTFTPTGGVEAKQFIAKAPNAAAKAIQVFNGGNAAPTVDIDGNGVISANQIKLVANPGIEITSGSATISLRYGEGGGQWAGIRSEDTNPATNTDSLNWQWMLGFGRVAKLRAGHNWGTVECFTVNDNSGEVEFHRNVIVTGTLTAGGSVVTSGKALKEDIRDVGPALAKVQALKVKTFTRKAVSPDGIDWSHPQAPPRPKHRKHETGFIAEEVAQILPDAVVQTPDGPGISILDVVATLTKAVQELSAEVTALRAKVGP